MEESSYYVYKLTVDNGGAPCVCAGMLSLAICKPAIRKNAKKGSYVFGFAGNCMAPAYAANPLIYVAATVTLLTALAVGARDAGKQQTVTGWVLDSACAFTKGLDKPISRECAVACARKGSPLVILQDDGTIYWPIAESTPAASQNERLLPYAGKRVTATGKVYARSGSQALVIEKLAAATK